ncbi:hypothetical protein HYX10_05480 [Candidatus Woesearchaeota archaeon]|nr:hypothetical protein [Candidatus Woesearchaeota archaeon]
MLIGYRIIEGALNIIRPENERKFLEKAARYEKLAYNALWRAFWISIVAAAILISLKVAYGTAPLAIAFTIAVIRQSLRSYMKVKYNITAVFVRKILRALLGRDVSKKVVYVVITVNAAITIGVVLFGYIAVLGVLGSG